MCFRAEVRCVSYLKHRGSTTSPNGCQHFHKTARWCHISYVSIEPNVCRHLAVFTRPLPFALPLVPPVVAPHEIGCVLVTLVIRVPVEIFWNHPSSAPRLRNSETIVFIKYFSLQNLRRDAGCCSRRRSVGALHLAPLGGGKTIDAARWCNHTAATAGAAYDKRAGVTVGVRVRVGRAAREERAADVAKGRARGRFRGGSVFVRVRCRRRCQGLPSLRFFSFWRSLHMIRWCTGTTSILVNRCTGTTSILVNRYTGTISHTRYRY